MIAFSAILSTHADLCEHFRIDKGETDSAPKKHQ